MPRSTRGAKVLEHAADASGALPTGLDVHARALPFRVTVQVVAREDCVSDSISR
jgi:hypothetical protein